MQKLQRAFFKNNYFYQKQTVLVNILTLAYNFLIKRIPRSLNIFTRKNERCYVSLLYYISGLYFSEDIKQ